MAKSMELSCTGISHGSSYEFRLFFIDSAVVGFRYVSADSSGGGDCVLESYMDTRYQVPFMTSEWHAKGLTTTIDIKSLDGVRGPKDYSHVIISRSGRSFDFEYKMADDSSACGVAGFLPNRLMLVPGVRKCVEVVSQSAPRMI